MKRSLSMTSLFAALALPVSSLAQEGLSVRDEVLAALESQASLPAHKPILPDAAAARAQEVHDTIAFGQKGAAQRAAQGAAERGAGNAARNAAAEAAERAAQRGQSAANAARAEEVRKGVPAAKPGRGKP